MDGVYFAPVTPITMNELFGRYIGNVFCSFMRITLTGVPYYIITSEHTADTCKATCNRNGKWELARQDDYFFNLNRDEILEVIMLHEHSIKNSSGIRKAG